jgi:hypothetical protein
MRISAIAAAASIAMLALTHDAIGQTASDVVCTGCVDTTDIHARAVTRDKIQNEAVNPAKLAPTAKPTGVAHISSFATVTPDNADVDIVTVSMTPPAGSGYAVAQAHYDVDTNPPDSAPVLCEIRAAGVPYADRYVTTGHKTVAGSIAAVVQAAAGSTTYSLTCNKSTAGTEPSGIFGSLVVTWVPQDYTTPSASPRTSGAEPLLRQR